MLFLDFDGVLVHESYAGDAPEEAALWSESHFDPAVIARVNALCARAGASVVISSSWRQNHSLDELRGMLERRGLRASVLGVTPSMHRSPDGRRLERGDEIQAWLDAHPEVRGFAIADDDEDMAHLRPFLVRTSMERGLSDEHCEALFAVFARQLGDEPEE